MSTLDEKLSQHKTVSGKAQCLLKKHLTYRDGTPKYKVCEADKSGPTVVKVASMGNYWLWRRVCLMGGDSLMELAEHGKEE